MGFPNKRPIPPPPEDMGKDPAWTRFFNLLSQNVPHVRVYTESLSPTDVGANTIDSQNFTVTGLQTTDIVYVTKPTYTTDIGIVGARVTTDDQLTIDFVSTAGSTTSLPTENYVILAIGK